MSGTADLLLLTVRHEFYGADPPPIKPRLAARPDRHLMFRSWEGGAELACHAGALAGPVDVEIELTFLDPALLDVTPPLSRQACAADATEPDQAMAFRVAGSGGMAGAAAGSPRLQLTLDPRAAPRAVLVTIPVLETLWTYHVSGGRSDADLSVRDPEGKIGFHSAGLSSGPGGKLVRSFRAGAAIALSRRPAQRFELWEGSASGARPVISPLPAASAGIFAGDTGHGNTRHGGPYLSDIHVFL